MQNAETVLVSCVNGSRRSHWRARRPGNRQVRFGGRPRGERPVHQTPRAACPTAWHNRGFKSLAIGAERQTPVTEVFIALANVTIIVCRLLRSTDSCASPGPGAAGKSEKTAVHEPIGARQKSMTWKCRRLRIASKRRDMAQITYTFIPCGMRFGTSRYASRF